MLKTVKVKCVHSGTYCMWHQFGERVLFLCLTTDPICSVTKRKVQRAVHHGAPLQAPINGAKCTTASVCDIFKVQSVPTNRLSPHLSIHPPRFVTLEVMWHAIAFLISIKHTAHTHTHTYWMTIYTRSYCLSHFKAAGRRFLWFKLSWRETHHLTSIWSATSSLQTPRNLEVV